MKQKVKVISGSHTAFRLPDSLRAEVIKICDERGWSFANAIRWSLCAWVRKPRALTRELDKYAS